MKIIFTGDWCPSTLPNLGEDRYGPFRAEFESCDVFVTNVECSLAKGTKRPKQGPHLYTDPAELATLPKGPQVVCGLANNHTEDYGLEGFNATQQAIYDAGHTPLLATVELPGDVLLVALAENEGQITTAGMERVLYHFRTWRSRFKRLIFIIHGGSEGCPLPSPRMQREYRQILDAGGDLIVGHHTHVPMASDCYAGKVINYGLGNFLFKSPFSDRGYFVTYDTETRKSDYTTYRVTDTGLVADDFRADIDRLNELEYERHWQAFARLKYREKYQRWIRELVQRGDHIGLQNFFQCASHRDVIIDGIKYMNESDPEAEKTVREIATI